MPFNVKKSDGTFLVTVQDLTIDQSATSLSLPGKAVAGYGLAIAQNFAYLVENFASITPPSRALIGQLWFDETVSLLRIKNEGGWSLVGVDAFGVTLDTLPGPTIAGNIGGTSNGANRISGSTGVPLAFNGAITTISILAGEGKIIAAASPEAIPSVSLPATITLEGKVFDFKARFPNGLCAGVMLASDSANYIYGGSTQFSDLLSQVPFILAGDDTSPTANTVVVTVPAQLTQYTKYLAIETKIANTSTGPVQVNINGLGLKNVVRRDTSQLQAGDLKATFYYHLIYDGLQFRVDDAQANGYVGPTGPAGLQGPTGPVGAASTIVGPTGATGATGAAGTNGTNANVTSGEGVQVANGQVGLDVPDLFVNDSVTSTDFLSYFSSADGHHRKTTVSNFATKLLALNSVNAASSVASYASSAKQAVGNLITTTANVVGNGNAYCGVASSGVVTITKSGLYALTGSVSSEQTIATTLYNVTGGFFGASFKINGQLQYSTAGGFSASQFYYTSGQVPIAQVVYLNAGDTVQLTGTTGQSAFPVGYINFIATYLTITFIE